MAYSLTAPNVIEVGPIHLTNTVLAGFLTTFMIIVFIAMVVRKPKMVPGRLQAFYELLFTTVYDLTKAAYIDEKRSRKFLPFYMTLFLFLLLANQYSALPLLSNIMVTTQEGTFPILRMSTADFSQTIALALISIGLAHIIAFGRRPIKHINNFLKFDKIIAVRKPADLGNLFIELFLGFMDIIGEFAKIISLSARLFGNIFAGDVMSAVIASLIILPFFSMPEFPYSAFLLPFPFIFLGMFSSLVQAFVFTTLSANFMAGTIKAVDD